MRRRCCWCSRFAVTLWILFSRSASLVLPSSSLWSASSWPFARILSSFSFQNAASAPFFFASFSRNSCMRKFSASMRSAWSLFFSSASLLSSASLSAWAWKRESVFSFVFRASCLRLFSASSLASCRAFILWASISSFLNCSSLSFTKELCWRSWDLRSTSKRLASFSKRLSSMDKNCPFWAPGIAPFFALSAMTFARSWITSSNFLFRFFS
mmetsp:Transcript_96875/g.273827  ORF Transcript_96875/g.273827 Transcript_96875/m.273827 type:complete len:212 (+) Transcript_96875:869-1504(+)